MLLVFLQILPAMSNEEASVRNLAVKAIGICCQLKQDIIKLHLPLLLQVIDLVLVYKVITRNYHTHTQTHSAHAHTHTHTQLHWLHHQFVSL
jgi:hypothetical protein